MKCVMCENGIEEGQMYCYTLDGYICMWCIESHNWYVPDFAMGRVGGRISTLELTQPPKEVEKDNKEDLGCLQDLYYG